MVKANKTMLFGMFLLSLVLVAGFASANTVVSGKIYNSDFSQVIEGAVITVECNSHSLDTESLNDGAYAIVFDSEVCGLGNEVKVSASKGDLSGSDDTSIEESEEEEGELVGVINLNLKGTSTSSGSGKKGSGTWFKCGNTVCDSGETYQTCAKDCHAPVQEPVKTTSNVSPNTEEETPEPQVTITTTSETTDSAITGAIIANDSGNKSKLPLSLIGIILLLIVGITGVSIAKNENNKRVPPKMQESMYKPLSVFY